MDLVVNGVWRQFGQASQIFGSLFARWFHFRGSALILQPTPHPLTRFFKKERNIAVPDVGVDFLDPIRISMRFRVKVVNSLHVPKHLMIAVGRKIRVLAAAHWVAAGQCDCIYFHNTYLEDFPAVGALIAPRPLLVLSGKKDPDFPPDGYHELFRRVKRIYDLHSEFNPGSDRGKEIDDDVGHSDIPLFLKAAREWMNRWLRNDSPPYREGQFETEKAEDLAVLSKLPSDAVNYKIHKL